MDTLEFCSDHRYNFFNNFVSYVWLCWVFTAVLGIPPAVAGRGTSLGAMCGLLTEVPTPVADLGLWVLGLQ